MFGTPAATSAFGTPAAFGGATPAAFGGTPSTPTFATTGGVCAAAFGSSSSLLFPSPPPFSSQSQQQQQQQSPSFSLFPPQQQQQTPSSFGFQQFTPSPSLFGNVPLQQQQLTTQMSPVAPLPLPLADRDIQATVDAYKDEPGNPKYSFRHLLFSVTDPTARVKPVGVSDIMWAEAMGKLEGMESADRERLWPQLVQGFKDLSDRLKLQDEVTASDTERLRMTQTNVKMLQRHFQTDTLPWIQRMRQKEQGLRRRLLRVIRIVEALEGKGFHVPLMKDEAELHEKLTAISRQLKGPGAELSRRVHNLLSISRLRADGGVVGSSMYLPGSAKIQEQSLAELQVVLQQETEAISKLGNVLKRDIRDMEIIMSEDTQMVEDGGGWRV